MHKYRADLLLHGKQIRLTGNGAHTVQQAAFALPGQNCQLRFLIGVAHYGADHETVQLRLRQHLRAGGADGVLGCNYGKGCGHRAGDAVHRHRAFFHHFQQSRLRAGGGTVDLIAQKQVTHHRTGVVHKLAGLFLVDRKSHQIGRQNIRRKLHAAFFQVQRAGKGQRQRGFAHAGNILNQHMAARQHGHPDGVYRLLFALHGLVYFGRNGGGLLCVLHG